MSIEHAGRDEILPGEGVTCGKYIAQLSGAGQSLRIIARGLHTLIKETGFGTNTVKTNWDNSLPPKICSKQQCNSLYPFHR